MLTDVEYHEIMACKGTLKLQIDAAESEKGYYDGMKDAADAKKDQLELRMSLYSNFLSDAIEEYEAAHQPEGE